MDKGGRECKLVVEGGDDDDGDDVDDDDNDDDNDDDDDIDNKESCRFPPKSTKLVLAQG